MSFKCGIVGLPNVGKSTLFNALSNAAIEAANYPFCTIEPNIGMIMVPDQRLDQITKIIKPKSIVPTNVRFVDIAGLVAGAAKGEGLGNKFLAHIRETQAIIHVVRCYDDGDIIHVSGKVDPLSDIEVIDTELCLADLEVVDKAILKCSKNTKTGDKEAIKNLSFLKEIENGLLEKPLRQVSLSESAIEIANAMNLITIKPVLYVANISESKNNAEDLNVQKIKEYAKQENSNTIEVCAKIEAEMSDLDEEDKAVFLADLGLSEPGLNRVIRSGYGLLDLITFFTAGEKEVRAWTVKKGFFADDAAGVIHTDFKKGFIRAEVVSFADFKKYNGEKGAKEAGVWRLEGKEYVVQDGDVMHFRFNV